MTIDIVICTESGYLEAQAKLLVYSIRHFGGFLKDAAIFSYQPRKGKQLQRSTLLFFEEHAVAHSDETLNTRYTHYPLANKPIATAHHEQKSRADRMIFLDSDTFFLRPPDFIKQNSADIQLRPVDIKNIGCKVNTNDPNTDYWQQLYKVLDVKSLRTVTTTVDKQTILEYYNSGMIVSNNRNELFQHWLRNFERIMRQNIVSRAGLFPLEQSTLSATISGLELHVALLPPTYNYPLHMRPGTFDLQQTSLEDIGHAHYHDLFVNPGGINPFKEAFDRFASGRLVNEKLEEYGVLRQLNRQLRYRRLTSEWKQRAKHLSIRFRSKLPF